MSAQLNAALRHQDNACDCCGSQEQPISEWFAEQPADVRADLLWDYIDSKPTATDLVAGFDDYVAERRARIGTPDSFFPASRITQAIALIHGVSPWASQSANADLLRAIKLLGDA